MKRSLTLLASLGFVAFFASCAEDQRRSDSNNAATSNATDLSAARKEIVARNVLGAQLASHDKLENKTTFGTRESIAASLYLANSSFIEARRISAFLVHDDAVIEEQTIGEDPGEKRGDLDFQFNNTPRPPGAYEIKFVEIARSNGKPVLLARLFLTVSD